jgi:hypothetical protein
MKDIRRADDDDLIDAANVDPEVVHARATQIDADYEAEQAKLLKNSKIAKWITVVLTTALLILWPFPMFGSGYIFSKRFFTGWVVVGILWVFFAFICVGIYPVWEGRYSIGRTLKAVFLDITGRRKSRVYHINGVCVQNPESDTPVPADMVKDGHNTVKAQMI